MKGVQILYHKLNASIINVLCKPQDKQSFINIYHRLSTQFHTLTASLLTELSLSSSFIQPYNDIVESFKKAFHFYNQCTESQLNSQNLLPCDQITLFLNNRQPLPMQTQRNDIYKYLSTAQKVQNDTHELLNNLNRLNFQNNNSKYKTQYYHQLTQTQITFEKLNTIFSIYKIDDLSAIYQDYIKSKIQSQDKNLSNLNNAHNFNNLNNAKNANISNIKQHTQQVNQNILQQNEERMLEKSKTKNKDKNKKDINVNINNKQQRDKKILKKLQNSNHIKNKPNFKEQKNSILRHQVTNQNNIVFNEGNLIHNQQTQLNNKQILLNNKQISLNNKQKSLKNKQKQLNTQQVSVQTQQYSDYELIIKQRQKLNIQCIQNDQKQFDNNNYQSLRKLSKTQHNEKNILNVSKKPENQNFQQNQNGYLRILKNQQESISNFNNQNDLYNHSQYDYSSRKWQYEKQGLIKPTFQDIKSNRVKQQNSILPSIHLHSSNNSKKKQPINQNQNKSENISISQEDMNKRKNILANKLASIHSNMSVINSNKMTEMYQSKMNQINRNVKLLKNQAISYSKQTLNKSDNKSKNSMKMPKQLIKIEEKIMKQLQQISKNSKNKQKNGKFKMYIQFFETLHLRQCGSNCKHLKKFYQFLKQMNIPNRKQVLVHKYTIDMNEKY